MLSLKKLNVFLGDYHKIFIYTRCLNSYASEIMLTLHKPKCENHKITTIKISSDSHLHWKNHFRKNPLFFRNYAAFEADNKIDIYSIGNKTTNMYNQNLVLNGCHIESELEDILQSSYYKTSLGCVNMDWFVKEVIELENKMAFFFKNTKKHNIMTEKDEAYYRNNYICRFCEKKKV